MVFIVGGAYQGKSAYARQSFAGYRIVDSYHAYVREQISAGEDPMAQVRLMLEDAEQNGMLDKMVVISDELGYGIVPVEHEERIYREANGRVNCYLAERAETVYRVIAGIATKIKG